LDSNVQREYQKASKPDRTGLSREARGIVVNDILELVAATARWSREAKVNPYFSHGTLWYGQMCRTFLLLERILRSILQELSSLAPSDAQKFASDRAQGKSVDRMTFGQCLAVIEMLVPVVSQRVCDVRPELADQELLSEADLKSWKRSVFLRNRMAHEGPGFLDSVDLQAGRIWRSDDEREPLDVQAQEIWQLSRSLCGSPLILSYLALRGIAPDVSRAELLKIENSMLEVLTVRRSGDAAMVSINEFHATSKR